MGLQLASLYPIRVSLWFKRAAPDVASGKPWKPRTSMDSKVVSLEQKVNPCWSILKGVGTPPPKDSRAFGRLSSSVGGPTSQKRGPLSGLSKLGEVEVLLAAPFTAPN